MTLRHKSVLYISTSSRTVYFGSRRKTLRFFWICNVYKEKSCYDEVIGVFEWPKTDYNQKCIPNQHRKEKKPLPTLPYYQDIFNGQL